MPTYQHRGRSFTMSNDGAIRVQRGHSLSLYSAALHGTGQKVREYGRLDPRTGRVLPITNVNLIHAGETIYHLPTRQGAQRRGATPQVITLPETVIKGKVDREAEERPGSPHTPRRLPMHDVETLQYKSHYQWRVGVFGTAKAGAVFRARGERRLLYEVFHTAVVYLVVEGPRDKMGRFYAQTKRGFIHDVETYVLTEAAGKAAGMKVVAEWEANILLGIASGVNVVGFAVVTGVSALQFVAENQHNFRIWKKVLEECLRARRVLKAYAPTLYDKLVDQLLLQFRSRVVPNIPAAAARDPKILGVLIGTMIAKLGRAALAGSRFKAVLEVSSILITAAVSALKSVPGAVGIAIDQEADEIIQALRKAGVRISKQDAKRIVQEVVDNPRQVKGALERLKRAGAGLR